MSKNECTLVGKEHTKHQRSFLLTSSVGIAHVTIAIVMCCSLWFSLQCSLPIYMFVLFSLLMYLSIHIHDTRVTNAHEHNVFQMESDHLTHVELIQPC